MRGGGHHQWHDSTHRRLWRAWERMLWLARSPRARTVVEVYDADGRKVSAP